MAPWATFRRSIFPGAYRVFESTLLHEFIVSTAVRTPGSAALCAGSETLNFETLQARVSGAAARLLELGLARSQRVAIWLEKRVEGVVASGETCSSLRRRGEHTPRRRKSGRRAAHGGCTGAVPFHSLAQA